MLCEHERINDIEKLFIDQQVIQRKVLPATALIKNWQYNSADSVKIAIPLVLKEGCAYNAIDLRIQLVTGG